MMGQTRTAITKACVLDKVDDLNFRDIDVNEPFTDLDVRIDIKKVGICGSDIHYYKHGVIGPFVVNEPMILGHEAAGVVTEVGSKVTHLKVGDRVCMEPGVPDLLSKWSQMGMYNVDPMVRFWATPPYYKPLHTMDDGAWKAGHGCIRPSVVHPGHFTFKIADHVSLEEAAMVEPLAVGMHACTKAQIKPGSVACIVGAGPIGMLTAMAALASGCAKVYLADTAAPKVKLGETLASDGQIQGIVVDTSDPNSLEKQILELTDDEGVELVIECSGAVPSAIAAPKLCAPGGTLVWVGCPPPCEIDIGVMQAKELRTEAVFRYAHMYPKTIAMLESGMIDVKPIITNHFKFDECVKAFDFMSDGNTPSDTVKSIIHVDK